MLTHPKALRVLFITELWERYGFYIILSLLLFYLIHFFHLSDQTHPAIYIVSGYSEPDVILQPVGPRSFIIRDNSQCRSGYAHVTVSYDISNWCVLDINDGPYMNHPTIHASCNGLKYVRLDHDSFGSNSYTIVLD